MSPIALVLVLFVGLLHTGFLILECFFWTKPLGLRIFRLTPETAAATRVMALNQGLYNGFLGAGLFWAALAGDPALANFFLACVAIAGVVGAVTASKNIIFIQALPAALGLLFTSGLL
jgi:putative membrane protein